MADKFTEDPSRQGAAGGAQIYHEKKGLPLWLWPLLALVLLGLLYAFSHRSQSTEQAQTASAPSTAPSTAPVAADNAAAAPSSTDSSSKDTAGNDIKVHSGTDIATAKPAQASVPGVALSNVVLFAAAADPASFIGRRAKLTNVLVQKVISDRAFFVGPTPQQQVLVLLDKGMDAGAGGSAKVTVATGQPVSLIGIVEAMPTQEAVSQTYGISGADYASVQSQKAYLHATVAQQK